MFAVVTIQFAEPVGPRGELPRQRRQKPTVEIRAPRQRGQIGEAAAVQVIGRGGQQPKRTAAAGRQAVGVAARQLELFEPLFQIGHDARVWRADDDVLGGILSLQACQGLHGGFRLIGGAVDHDNLLVVQIDRGFAPGGDLQGAQLVKPRGERSRSMNQHREPVLDRFQHAVQNAVRIGDPDQHDFVFRAADALFQCLQPRPLAIYQSRDLQASDVCVLHCGHRQPAVALDEILQFLSALGHVDEPQRVAGQLDMQLAEQIGQGQPARRIVDRRQLRNDAFQPCGAHFAQRLGPDQLASQRPDETPGGRVQLFGQVAERYDSGRAERQRALFGLLHENLEQPPPGAAAGHGHDQPIQGEHPVGGVSLE